MKIIKKICLYFATILILGISIVSCGNKNEEETKDAVESTTPTADEDGNIEANVNITGSEFHGTLSKKWKKDEPTNKEKKNIANVQKILEETNLEKDNRLYECIYGDLDSELSVWSLVSGDKNESLNYYGLIIRNEGKDYLFADICHGKNPVADYNDKTKKLIMSADVIEGTGVHADALYAFDIKKNDVTNIALLDPYDVQEYFAEHMTYDVKQNDITFKLNNKVISQMTNHEDGYGTLRALAVGEQIAYEFDDEHNIKVNVTPGIKFGPGINLFYDETPTFSADVKLSGNKFTMNNIKLSEE